jgi:hypothetical protein
LLALLVFKSPLMRAFLFLGLSIPRRMALHASDVSLAIRHAASFLAFVDHAAQAFHRLVMRTVQGVEFVRE